jgi:hypothetical protein
MPAVRDPSPPSVALKPRDITIQRVAQQRAGYEPRSGVAVSALAL